MNDQSLLVIRAINLLYAMLVKPAEHYCLQSVHSENTLNIRAPRTERQSAQMSKDKNSTKAGREGCHTDEV